MQPSADTTADGTSLRDRILKEIAVIGGFILAGLVVLPMLVYLVGQRVFGDYGASGFKEFYLRLHEDLRSGEPAAVFLLLSPCILWLLLRLTLWLFRRPHSGPG